MATKTKKEIGKASRNKGKRVERLNLKKAYEQAVNDSKENGNNDIPAVFHRGSYQPWMVTCSLEDFLKLYKKGDVNK